MHKLVFIPVFFLGACNLAPETTLPDDNVPESWVYAEAAEAATHQARWEDFGNAELDRLMADAIQHNTDLAAALARVEQARAGATIAASPLYPQLDASGSISHTRQDSDFGSDKGTPRSAGLNLSYEVDLWQRYRNLSNSAEAQLAATRYDRDAVALLVTSEVARLYIGSMALETRQQVAIRNLEATREILRITQARNDAGSLSGLELAQQKTVVSSAEAQLASINNQRAQFKNQLAMVTGRAPANLMLQASSLDSLRQPEIKLLSPWQLLERRPDIQRAEAQLRAANYDIGTARAQALPSIGLGLSGSIAGNPYSAATGLAASFFAPIFQGGALQGEIERSTARRDELLAGYEGVLLTAFREVEDALAGVETSRARAASLADAAVESQRAYDIANLRYKAGSVDFQALLDTQQNLLQAQDAEVSARQASFAASVELLRALGGSWQTENGREETSPPMIEIEK